MEVTIVKYSDDINFDDIKVMVISRYPFCVSGPDPEIDRWNDSSVVIWDEQDLVAWLKNSYDHWEMWKTNTLEPGSSVRVDCIHAVKGPKGLTSCKWFKPCENCSDYKRRMGTTHKETRVRVYHKDTREGILESIRRMKGPDTIYVVQCQGKRQAWLEEEISSSIVEEVD